MDAIGATSATLISFSEGNTDAADVPVIHIPAACDDLCGASTGSGNTEAPADLSTLHSFTAEAVSIPDELHVDTAGEGSSGSGYSQNLEEASTYHTLDATPETVPSAALPSLFFPALMGGSEGVYDRCICAICLDKIQLVETSQIKGCEHSYCVTCILRWALYKTNPWCPQCRLPFTELYVYKALDGSLNDYLFEESVCLLLRASWFKGMPILPPQIEESEDYHEEDDCFDDYYFKSNVRIGNRRWGDNGYVRAGRKEARPVGVRHLAAAVAQADEAGCSSFRPGNSKGKEKTPPKEATGRRAKRAQKREAYDKLQTQQGSVRSV